METLRVLIDSSDPCPACGSPATVFQLSIDEGDWIDEQRECSHGCDELVAAIPVGSGQSPLRRRRRVA